METPSIKSYNIDRYRNGFGKKKAMIMLSSIVLILGSLLFIGAGIFCILQPEISLLIVGWYIGFVLVLGGALQIIRFFQIDPGYRSFWHLLIALLDVVFGIWMLVSMVFTLVAYMLPLMFAIYILLRGILMIVLRKKKEKEMKHSSLYMPVAIIEILIGAALVLRPDAASIIFMYCVALALIWTGISTFMIWRQSEAADDSES